MKILAGFPDGLLIFLIVIGFFAVVAIVAYIIHRIIHPRLKDDQKDHVNTEEENAREELDRILQPIEDEEVAKKVEEYKEDDE